MHKFIPELWLEQLKFLPGYELYRCKLVSRQWKEFIESCEACLPIVPKFPSELNASDAYVTIEVSKDSMRAEFTAPNFSWQNVGSVRADRPIPLALGFYYFEVSIIDGGQNSYIGIGLANKEFGLNNEPGWSLASYGYHGDDGCTFHNYGVGIPYGPTFSTGDTIGCGINFMNGKIFYTKNGEYLGTAARYVHTSVEWYQTIGLASPDEIVEVNFGQKPYLYDFMKLLEDCRTSPLLPDLDKDA